MHYVSFRRWSKIRPFPLMEISAVTKYAQPRNECFQAACSQSHIGKTVACVIACPFVMFHFRIDMAFAISWSMTLSIINSVLCEMAAKIYLKVY
jgi:hypothetical protein